MLVVYHSMGAGVKCEYRRVNVGYRIAKMPYNGSKKSKPRRRLKSGRKVNMNDIERIENLDEYHNRLDCWVMNTFMHILRALGGNRYTVLRYMERNAKRMNYAPPFVFQDEDARHFNHDVMLECHCRLGA